MAKKKAAARKSPAAKKKVAKKSAAPNPSPIDTNGVVTSINVRMYRAGTGDCFLLQCKKNQKVTFNIMIDCGCINGAKTDFQPWIKDITQKTGGVIDLLIVTHEHADHINGFKICADLWKNITFKKVWFAWTENEDDPVANDLRENHSKIKMALASATQKLTGLVQGKYYNNLFKEEIGSAFMIKGKEKFITSLDQVNQLNVNNRPAAKGKIPSMVELFRDNFNVIKKDTEVECYEPGALIHDLRGAEGLRFYVLGPPKDAKQMSITERSGEVFEKREEKSTTDFAFAAAAVGDTLTSATFRPFGTAYELSSAFVKNNQSKLSEQAQQEKFAQLQQVRTEYQNTSNAWRSIDNDWLFTAGSLALRFESSINNTSLVLAIQFEESERVLLFPGDAEFGNWQSWHVKTNTWTIQGKDGTKKVNAQTLLNNTVFYKVGHHCSQNGSASRLGVDMMIHEDLAAMATLNFKKINDGWLNTMPNDLLGAELITKTKGKLYFNGDCATILPNIKTDRVTVKKANEDALTKLNKAFDGQVFIDYEVNGSNEQQ